jgi:uncharacterized membrane protein
MRPAEARPAPTRPTATSAVRVPVWLPIITLALVVAGLAVAGYLTVEHYTASTTLACPEHGVVNCQKVTTSAQSFILGVPVALLGLLYFAAMLPLCLPASWRATHRLPHRTRTGLAVIGVAMVIYLVYTELFTLNAICLWCTAVHAITLALFAVILIGAAGIQPAD